MDDLSQGDICRVCRCEAQSDRPLFYPCICTGSIKYIHQDCLMQWMRYSHKEYCELCGHRFSFQPIYSPDMPRVLPLRDVVAGLLGAIAKAAKSWFHYSLVGLAWFGVVPLSAYRTYRYLFRASSLDMILSLPFDVFSTENLASDAFRGCFVVTCTLLSFIGLVWLRDQILHGGGPDWFERDDNAINANLVGNEEDVANEGNELEAIPANQFNDRQANNQNNDDEVVLAVGNDNNNNNAVPVEIAEAVVQDEAEEAIGNINDENHRENAAEIVVNADNDSINEDNNQPLVAEAEVVDAVLPPAAAAAAHQEQPIENLVNNNAEENVAIENAEENIERNPAVVNQEVAENANNDAVNPAQRDFNPAAAVGGEADNDNEEPAWNPMEWDRAAEELTWERLLGLDGSLLFLEHVFWIISLNTMFIFIFAFCPYCIGNFILNWLKLLQLDKPILHFHGLLTTLFGYCVIGISLMFMHYFACIFRLRRIRWIIGLCYIVVKVSLLSVIEIGVLPLVCGWWLDICSLPLFDASLKDRKMNFQAAPGTSLFVHWMFGMVYVYYFAAFISLLREVLRPGVLWIFRNVNDPDFSPLQEMIHVPILRHVRRLIASAVIFGSAVLLILWLPIKILKNICPTFLPYTLSGDSEVNELSLQLLLLQIILPGFFEQSHTRLWLKSLLRLWCICVSWLLGLRSYLLGNEKNDNPNEPNVDGEQNGGAENNEAAAEDGNGGAVAGGGAGAGAPGDALPMQMENNLAAAHEAMRQREVIVGYQPYDRPSYFPIRLMALLVIMSITIVIASLITLTVPVWIGRQFMSLWAIGNHIGKKAVHAQGTDINGRSHELYTAAIGTYFCWIISRGATIAANLLPQGKDVVINKMKQWIRVGLVYALPVITFIVMLSIIPLLYGLLLELVVVIPLRVPLYQTPVHFLWQDWALGVLYTKISIALTLMGPDWHMKRALERAYRDGLRDINLKFLITDLALPVVTFFGLALSVPYVLAHTILPMFIKNPITRLEISRTMYPFFFIIVGIIAYIYFEISQFKKLYVAIKVDKYLVGQRLVNYENRKRQDDSTECTKADASAQVDEDDNANNEKIDPALIIEQDAIIRRRREAAAAAAEREALMQRLVGDGEAEVL